MNVWVLVALIGLVGEVVSIAAALRLPPKHKHEN